MTNLGKFRKVNQVLLPESTSSYVVLGQFCTILNTFLQKSELQAQENVFFCKEHYSVTI